ncbi:MAG: hypothetical protein KAI81_00665 [Candidatus Marinimicrobia bacterium]|nr:hypothetical protein [Candidatus Neomarinimicrobiota bacterium]
MTSFNLFAEESKAVYISPQLPYLSEISHILQNEGYKMYTDSLTGAWIGELVSETSGDSVLYQLNIISENGLASKHLGTFKKEGFNKVEVKKQFLKMFLYQTLSISAVLLFYFISY